MAIVEVLKEWQIYLIGTRYSIMVYNDHKNLVYFIQTKDLNKRYVRWMMILSKYDFSIQYQKGTFNGKVDVLSRRPDLDTGDCNRSEILLYQEGNIFCLTIFDTRNYIDPDLDRRIRKIQEEWEKKYLG